MRRIEAIERDVALHQAAWHAMATWTAEFEFLRGRRPTDAECLERYYARLDADRGYVLIEGEAVEVPLALPAHAP